MQKKALLTFDYEMFMYKSGTVQKCLIEPTALILRTLKEKKVSATFYIDVLFLQVLEENKENASVKLIEEQLKQMVEEDHRIELHLHPQWLKTEKKENQWIFPHLHETYRIQQFNENEVEKMFNYGVEKLNKVAQNVDSTYLINSFRAGGLCVLPFENIRKNLLKHNIFIDSSVAAGLKADGSFQQYDFSNIKNNLPYKFDESPLIKSIEGEFLEIPITIFDENLLIKIRKTLSKKSSEIADNKIFGDGKAVPPVSVHQKGLVSKIASKFQTHKNILSLDNCENYHFEYLFRKEDETVLNILSHPKLMSPKSITILRNILNLPMKFMDVKSFSESI